MEACLNYLATPFTRHPRGLDAAFREACFTAELVRRLGLDVYCPIEETFSVSKRTKIDPLDYEFWQAVIAPWIPRCDRILVAMIDGWEQSVGNSLGAVGFGILAAAVIKALVGAARRG